MQWKPSRAPFLWLDTCLWSSFVVNLMSLIVIFQKRVQVRPLQLGRMESLIDPVVTLIKQWGEPGQEVKSIWPSIYRWGSAFVMVIRRAPQKATSAVHDFCKWKNHVLTAQERTFFFHSKNLYKWEFFPPVPFIFINPSISTPLLSLSSLCLSLILFPSFFI